MNPKLQKTQEPELISKKVRKRSCKFIDQNIKEKLLDLVRSGKKISEAAHIIKLNYSTAKTIIYYTRNQNQQSKKDKKQTDNRWFFTKLEKGQTGNQIQVKSSIFGESEATHRISGNPCDLLIGITPIKIERKDIN